MTRYLMKGGVFRGYRGIFYNSYRRVVTSGRDEVTPSTDAEEYSTIHGFTVEARLEEDKTEDKRNILAYPTTPTHLEDDVEGGLSRWEGCPIYFSIS